MSERDQMWFTARVIDALFDAGWPARKIARTYQISEETVAAIIARVRSELGDGVVH